MKTINGLNLIAAIKSGANNMSNNKARIDSMNVFPVPDGDTGSNMGATIEYASSELSKVSSKSAGDVAKKFARGLLLGARGNSGVILSQIFKGFAVALEGKDEVNPFDLVEAFDQAREYAYKSVMKPVEGTILTVIRMTHEDLNNNVTPSTSIEEFFQMASKYAKAATLKTPEYLPVLKEVGVTDSGGEGLLVLIQGMDLYFQGQPVEISDQQQAIDSRNFFEDDEDFNGEFGYCTEFIVDVKNPKKFDKNRFRKALEKMGNSIVVVHDEDILKVHIHTKKPGTVFNFAQKFGEFIKLKSENMTLQANETQAIKEEAREAEKKEVNIGVVSVNLGDGIVQEMKSLGTDFVINGGQSSNPSAQDFMTAIDSLNTDKVILLPNNSNVILVAQQVAQTSSKHIVVIPTRTQMEGITAMINFDREAKLEDNQEMMNEAIEDVVTGQVTKAARTTKIEGVSVTEGEYLAIHGKKILKSTKAKTDAAKAIIDAEIDDDTELVTIWYGDNSTESDSEELASYIETHFDADVEIKNGKQPTYNFLISFE